jgi:hypothetical protein
MQIATKRFIGGSIAMAAGMAMVFIGHDQAYIKYNDYMAQATLQHPEVRQIESLGYALQRMDDAEGMLEDHLVGKFFMSPDTRNAVSHLESASQYLGKADVQSNPKASEMERKVGLEIAKLEKMPDGKSESFYESDRQYLQSVEADIKTEMELLKSQVPDEVLQDIDHLRLDLPPEVIAGALLVGLGGLTTATSISTPLYVPRRRRQGYF